MSTDLFQPVYGPDGEPCASCGAPLAGNQRYCLYCGVRRAKARIEFLDALEAEIAPPPSAAAAAPPLSSGLNGRLRAHSGTLGLAGLLLGTLLTGLLVGHWATSSPQPSAKAQQPQIIRVPAAAASATAPATTTGDETATTDAEKPSSAKKKAATKTTAAATAKTAKPPKDAVSVDKASAKDIEKAADKGKPIATGDGSELPPTDDKAPAGGAGFDEIG